MSSAALYMSLAEHQAALRDAGFSVVDEIRREGSLVLYRAQIERP